MKNFILALVIGFISFGPCLYLYERVADKDPSDSFATHITQWRSVADEFAPEHSPVGATLRAPGKIEGLTETVEVRARIDEQITKIHVAEGEQVSKGDLLVSLDSESLIEEKRLAAALLQLAVAKKQRLENGARSSEIEAAKQEYEANLTPLWSAERSFQRGQSLFEGKAISQQALDELRASVDLLKAKSAAAQARLETLKLPARVDELSAANADIQAARSRLNLASIRLKHSQLTAPFAGQVLEVNARIGELTGPKSQEPMIVMVDTSQLHAVAEVDEFDALRVKLGLSCQITSDANEGILAVGKIIAVEPRMQQKKIYGQWAAERNDTFSRRVRIALEQQKQLPIGLPVEVVISTD